MAANDNLWFLNSTLSCNCCISLKMLPKSFSQILSYDGLRDILIIFNFLQVRCPNTINEIYILKLLH